MIDITKLNRLSVAAALCKHLRRAADLQTGEQELIMAVIEQAVYDALSTGDSHHTNKADKEGAILFLTERRMGGLCGLIGIDEDYALDQVRKIAPLFRHQPPRVEREPRPRPARVSPSRPMASLNLRDLGKRDGEADCDHSGRPEREATGGKKWVN